jgi:hypothetical protein
MDNVAFHHSKDFNQLLNQHNLQVTYNPPYYPDTNPVEMIFSILKSEARKCQPTNLLEINEMIERTISNRLTSSVLTSSFTHAFAK